MKHMNNPLLHATILLLSVAPFASLSQVQSGCTDPSACNFNYTATSDDESCVYAIVAGDCEAGVIACGEGTHWNPLLQQCVVSGCQSCTGDLEADGLVNTPDLLAFLSVFGTTCPPPGCTDPMALNYNPQAQVNDGSCLYPPCLNLPPGTNCDGSCTIDEDFDGICDGEDPCVTEKANCFESWWAELPNSVTVGCDDYDQVAMLESFQAPWEFGCCTADLQTAIVGGFGCPAEVYHAPNDGALQVLSLEGIGDGVTLSGNFLLPEGEPLLWVLDEYALQGDLGESLSLFRLEGSLVNELSPNVTLNLHLRFRQSSEEIGSMVLVPIWSSMDLLVDGVAMDKLIITDAEGSSSIPIGWSAYGSAVGGSDFQDAMPTSFSWRAATSGSSIHTGTVLPPSYATCYIFFDLTWPYINHQVELLHWNPLSGQYLLESIFVVVEDITPPTIEAFAPDAYVTVDACTDIYSISIDEQFPWTYTAVDDCSEAWLESQTYFDSPISMFDATTAIMIRTYLLQARDEAGNIANTVFEQVIYIEFESSTSTLPSIQIQMECNAPLTTENLLSELYQQWTPSEGAIVEISGGEFVGQSPLCGLGQYAYEYTQYVNGCSATGEVLLELVDTTAPEVLFFDPAVVSCDEDWEAIEESGGFPLYVYDACSSWTCSGELISNDCTPGSNGFGSRVYLVTVTDACGNQSEAYVEYWTYDDVAPVVLETEVENGQTIYTNCSTVVPEPLDLVAIDNCSEVIETFSEGLMIVDGEFGTWDVIERTYQFEDCAGNGTEFTYNIWVGDVNPPFLEVSIAETTISCGDQVPFPAYTATDDCGTPNVSFSLSYDGDPQDCSTNTVATWTVTATDGNGNQSIESIDVTILGNPQFTCGNPVGYQGYDYATVQIGDQCWFAENLRSENYENGDAIPSNLSASEWSSTISGATAVYGEGDSGCDAIFSTDVCDESWSLIEYGRLYNWYAVDDPRGLCPNGWHVPTDGEWMTMEMGLGMTEEEANSTGSRGTNQSFQMKADVGWYSGGNGSNSSGFSALPGGTRNSNYSSNTGSFYGAGGNGRWWTSSTVNGAAWDRSLYYSLEGVWRNERIQRFGLSVRCIQDAE